MSFGMCVRLMHGTHVSPEVRHCTAQHKKKRECLHKCLDTDSVHPRKFESIEACTPHLTSACLVLFLLALQAELDHCINVRATV